MDLNVTRFEYSLKNIPIPGKNEYLRLLIEKVQALIRRVRWKAFFFEKALSNDTSRPTGKTTVTGTGSSTGTGTCSPTIG